MSDTLNICPICEKQTNTEKGLKIHITKIHPKYQQQKHYTLPPSIKKIKDKKEDRSKHSSFYDTKTLDWIERESDKNCLSFYNRNLNGIGRSLRKRLVKRGLLRRIQKKHTQLSVELTEKGVALMEVIRKEQRLKSNGCDY